MGNEHFDVIKDTIQSILDNHMSRQNQVATVRKSQTQQMEKPAQKQEIMAKKTEGGSSNNQKKPENSQIKKKDPMEKTP